MPLLPNVIGLDEHVPCLCRIVAQTSWLPHPTVVRVVGRAVFPTIRAKNRGLRFSQVLDEGQPVGMYDDNTTPTWALLWAHGIKWRRKGWTFAHVWTVADDINSYTHPANLVMVPECLASLTDKDGPLTGYLRWHAWTIYGWKPDHVAQPEMPADYGVLNWRYFEDYDAPKGFISQMITQYDNRRVRLLRPIMEKLDMLSTA